MKKKLTLLYILAGAMMLPPNADAQQILTLEQCREMALSSDPALKATDKKREMAEYDRRTAMAYRFPDISVVGTYQYNSRNLSLLPENVSDFLQNGIPAGRTATGGPTAIGDQTTIRGQTAIGNQTATGDRTTIGGQTAIGDKINGIMADIDEAFTLHTHNVFAGAVNITQPIFTGGKIANAGKMAELAKELSEAEYDAGRQEIIMNVDRAYWQTVSISSKKRLAGNYADLLHMMEHDTEILEKEGMATGSDVLAVKVKANEADMLYTKAWNGLELSKMLLCKLCGLDLDTEIVLADEDREPSPTIEDVPVRSKDEIFASRPEIRSLDLAVRIYDRKTAVARADMMPQIALTGNYIITNPNMFHGYRNSFGGFFNIGVTMKIPIIHGLEASQKTKRAKAEAEMMRYSLDEAMDMVTLQVSRLHKRMEEAIETTGIAYRNLESAEENLRTATVGFNEGVITSNTLFAAQTAWLQAHTGYLDAWIDVQLSRSELLRAEGCLGETPRK